MNKIIVIAGPTASGKSQLGIQLAKKLNTEIISCDSMQVYKEMNIGTAKPTLEEMEGIKHHMLDVVSPNEDFNVVKYIEMTKKIIEDMLSKNMIPILVGGTGLYVEALIYNIEFSDTYIDAKYREELSKFAKTNGNEALYERLKEIDIEYAKKIHINDTKRIIRALEVYHQTGKTITEYNLMSKNKKSPYDFYLFGINVDRQKLYDDINKRIDVMLDKGLVDEVKGIYEKYDMFPTAMQGLGYKEVKQYLQNECTYDEMLEKLKMETRRYAKRQLTWFRRYENMVWLDKEKMNIDKMVEYIIANI